MDHKNIKVIPSTLSSANSILITTVAMLVIMQQFPHVLSGNNTSTSTTPIPLTTTGTTTSAAVTTTGTSPQGTSSTTTKGTTITLTTSSTTTAATTKTTVANTTTLSTRKSTPAHQETSTTLAVQTITKDPPIAPTSTTKAITWNDTSVRQQSANSFTTSSPLDLHTKSGVLTSSLTTKTSSLITQSLQTNSFSDRVTLTPVTSQMASASTLSSSSRTTNVDTDTNTMSHSSYTDNTLTTMSDLQPSSRVYTSSSRYTTPSHDTGPSTGHTLYTSDVVQTETSKLTPVIPETSSVLSSSSVSGHINTESTTRAPTFTSTKAPPSGSDTYVSSTSSYISGNTEKGMPSIMSTTPEMTRSTTSPLLSQINDLQNQYNELKQTQSQYIIAVAVLVVIIVIFIVGIALYFYRKRVLRMRKQDDIFLDTDLSTEETKARRKNYMDTEIHLGTRIDGRYSVASIGDADGDSHQFNTFTRNKTQSSVNGATKLQTVEDEDEETKEVSDDNVLRTLDIKVDIDALPPPEPGTKNAVETEPEVENNSEKETSELLTTNNMET